MLIVNYVINTLPNEKTEILKNRKRFSQLRSRSKRIGRREKSYFKTKVLVPKIAVVRKEEGATAAASHLPSLSGPLRRAGRANRDFSKPLGETH